MSDPVVPRFPLRTFWQPPPWAVPALLLAGGGLAAALLLWTGGAPRAWAVLPFALAAPLLAAVDIAERRLPDVLTLPLIAVTAVILVVAAGLRGTAADLLRGAAGGAMLGVLFFVFFLFARGAFGFGDVKLGVSMGLMLGQFDWFALIGGVLASFLLAGVWAVGLIVFAGADRKTTLPMGPFLIVGSLAVAALSLALGASS